MIYTDKKREFSPGCNILLHYNKKDFKLTNDLSGSSGPIAKSSRCYASGIILVPGHQCCR